ncbi:DUF2637 domain-containing protein [Dactylosporangium sp. AC04546]|uniref:DUF2637 domain-containing protein n=1 Tax=Dactylosporangium sp. AC04546 TaxID=2862460 RepID=UPI001EDFAC92|nr:DUF2637 domain-containing protein [Dactylosporangium sp. AC04546]WVK78950.1 DUF2637 domain-containing protein [Dactylosporangium sp. AC04546]
MTRSDLQVRSATMGQPVVRSRPMTAALTRLAAAAGAAVVAGIAAWASWRHMVEVATTFGEDPLVAKWVPVSVDGMLVVASALMAGDKTNGRRPRISARVAFVVGVAASLAANIAAADPTIGARIVAGWPPLALFLVVEMLNRTERPTLVAPVTNATPPAIADPHASADGIRSVTSDATPTASAAADVSAEPAVHPPAVSSPNELGLNEPPSGPFETAAPDLPTEEPAKDRSGPPERARPPVLTSRARVERAYAERPDGTPAQIAADAAVSESTARRYLPRGAASAAESVMGPGDGTGSAV